MSEFVCPECDRPFKSKSALTGHVNKEHGSDELTKLRAAYGSAAPVAGGVLRADRLEAAPSGIPSIDYIMGIGGVPKGTMVEVFGPPKAGKTLTALTFSAHAQQNGGLVGFVDAERALKSLSYFDLIPNLDADAMEYTAGFEDGETALNITRDFIKTNQFAVWTVDSIHALAPGASMENAFGTPAARASLARLMSEALPVLAQIVSATSTVLVLINHVKTKPGVTYGRDWYTPGGSAPEYYSSVRLKVWASGSYQDKKTGRQIGHRVKVKVEKAKMAAPHGVGEYDLYYQAGTRKDNGLEVAPGIDIASSWAFVLMEEGVLTQSKQGHFINTETGEKIDEYDMYEQLKDPDSEMVKRAREAVYPDKFVNL